MNNIKECIARRLKETRIASGRSRAEVAVRLGVSESAVGHYERGFRTPDIEQFQVLSDYFEVSMSYLLCIDSEETKELKGDDIPKELKELGVTFMTVLKEVNEAGISPEDMLKLVKAIKEIKN